MKALQRIAKKGLKNLWKCWESRSPTSVSPLPAAIAFNSPRSAVFGISRDSLASHQRFKEKLKFPFELLADPDEAACKRIGVMKMKNMYGKQVRGIPKGLRGVQVTGHAQEVLNFVKAL